VGETECALTRFRCDVIPMIHIGTKITERKLGWVADFCPICRLPRAFQFWRLGEATTLYGVAMTEGALVGLRIDCAECGSAFDTTADRNTAIEPQRPEDFSYLVFKTFPTMPETMAERFGVEERLRRNPKNLTAEERTQLLVEPFVVLNAMVQRRESEVRLDPPSAIGCAATLLLLIAAVCLWHLVPWRFQDEFVLGAIGLLTLGMLYTFLQLHLAPKRYLQRVVVPNLVKALTPLAPEREELQAVLDVGRKEKRPLARDLKLEVLWEKLHPRRKG